jgi:ADP-dependent NAD(P)H-hydrate dehydratase / NAD(P)H-hydrate epimerase
MAAMKLVTAEEMRRIDTATIQERNVTGLELMERAGEAAAETILSEYEPHCVGVVTGKGNNAGDGLVVARVLAQRDVRVRVLTLIEPQNLSDAGRANFERLPEGVEILDRHSVPLMATAFEGCDVIVDAILGTGITGPVRGTFGEAIAVMNSLDIPVVAIDIPSGLNADTGLAEGACVIADLTVTMGLPKRGLVLGQGPEFCGQVVVADIGFPEDLLQDPNLKLHALDEDDVSENLPDRPFDGHKGTFGSLLVVAGQIGMSGAAYLTTATALRSGCGLVYAAFPGDISHVLAGQLVEAIKIPIPGGSGHFLTHDSWDAFEPYFVKADAIALGPGIGTRPETARLVDEMVCLDIPMVIDADGLNCLGTKAQYLGKRPAPTIVTPHPGEMGRLLGIPTDEVQENRIEMASRLAQDAQVVVVLKGPRTLVAAPDGRVFVNTTGNNGMAKGGSGDVLTGLIGGLLAQGCSALGAACAGVYLHGLAGDLARDEMGVRGMTAGDILRMIPEALKMHE